MSDAKPSEFGKFVPGFDFLLGLSKGQAPAMPGLGNWVAPTLDPAELEKRIGELKSVQFWLDQNTAALKATIQAMEVQKMTLATLKGMNLDLGAMAQAFQAPGAAAAAKPAAGSGPASAQAAPAADALQWWGALTQQFQQIANAALQEFASTAAPAPAAKAGAAAKKAAPAKAKAAKKTGARSRRRSAQATP